MEVTRYQFSRSANNSEERVLAHYSEVVLFLEGEPDIPEELQGAKKGMLYLTQYKIIFQHKDKGSTIIRFPLQLLGDCFLEEEPDFKPQHIKGTLTSTQGLLAFKFTFQYGASDCLNMIKDLVDSDILKEATNLQEYPTASIYTYAHPAAPQTTRKYRRALFVLTPFPKGAFPRGATGFSWKSFCFS
ncbi:WW domain-binding protein 2-like, partial [Thamnophis elegans]|uniref:WW domain-binding protein 2-like n=1 Tax=Thamnophis elegans TaxID=35005 RepID=UPI0013786A0E